MPSSAATVLTCSHGSLASRRYLISPSSTPFQRTLGEYIEYNTPGHTLDYV